MADHVVEQLHDYAAGHLTPEEVTRVEDHLHGCESCRVEAEEIDRVADGLSAAPPAVLDAVKQKLAGVGRFEHLLPQVSELLDVSINQARMIVGTLDTDANWPMELARGVWLSPIEGGPKTEGAFTVLVKVSPGAVFPTHTHGGRERVLVLEGGYTDISGTEFWRGELDVREKGSAHSFTGLPGMGCLCAAVMYPVGEML